MDVLPLQVFRRAFHGPFIAAGGHSRASGIAAIKSNHADAIAYGRPYLANPDLVKRFELDAALNKYDRCVMPHCFIPFCLQLSAHRACA